MPFTTRAQEQQNFPQFRQSLTYEDTLRIQIQKCLDAMSLNDLPASAAAIRVLTNMLYSDMTDQDYLEHMQQLQDDWKVEYRKRLKKWKRDLQAASGGCPDLIDRPSNLPGQDYWEKAFRNDLELCGRKGLLMKPTVEDSIS